MTSITSIAATQAGLERETTGALRTKVSSKMKQITINPPTFNHSLKNLNRINDYVAFDLLTQRMATDLR